MPRVLALLDHRGRAAFLAAALAVGVTVLGFVDENAAHAPSVLFVVPVALVAIAFGFRGGLAAGCAAAMLMFGLNVSEESLGLLGYVSRGTALLLVGVLVGAFSDAARRLSEELARFHTISLDMLAIADLEGTFVHVNPAWERTLGYSREELLSRPYVSFVHPDDVEATVAASSELAEPDGEVAHFRNRYRAAEGGYRWLEWAAKTYGGLIYASARDVSRSVEAEQMREQYNRLLELQVAERTRDVEAARLETLERLARAAEYRDDDTRLHTERVGALSAALAAELGCDEELVGMIRQAAPLHDVGKLGIPDRVLLKPGKLTPQERAVMQRHVEIGISILHGSTSAVLRLATEIVATHHEWWNGSGYPNGRAGESIPLAGRIVALADVYDALLHDRPYKKAWPVERAQREISALAGRQFDPDVVDAFERINAHEGADFAAVG